MKKRFPNGYLGCVDAKLVLEGRDIPLTFDIYGHRVAPADCMVVDRVRRRHRNPSLPSSSAGASGAKFATTWSR